jgi:hypothetical protein
MAKFVLPDSIRVPNLDSQALADRRERSFPFDRAWNDVRCPAAGRPGSESIQPVHEFDLSDAGTPKRDVRLTVQ